MDFLTSLSDHVFLSRLQFAVTILNVAVGVASGLVLEFQFGTNCSRFSAATHGAMV